MFDFLAKALNEIGNTAQKMGKHKCAKFLYRSATIARPSWSSPWYNLGLQAKYRGEWQASLLFNDRASSLDPDDQASWWNLGIAATALKDWATAQRAWNGCGIGLDKGVDEISMPPVTACVRLNPSSSGEVVWGTRIDPARILILNVPLPNSGRHFRDILLNDGSPAGTRQSGEQEYPVFDELGVWQPSMYSTFQSSLSIADRNAEQRLIELCNESDIGLEDWGTVRILCASCSQGSPVQHNCPVNESRENASNYGFGATSRETLVQVLSTWSEEFAGRGFSEPHLVLMAT